MKVPDFDAVVLAGGRAERLGGISKPDVVVDGRRMLDHVLGATAGAARVVVVAPESVAVPDGVIRTLEDPPHGGPAAGLAAGLAALDDGAGLVLVLACDGPWVATAVPRLLAAAEGGRVSRRVDESAEGAVDGASVDGAVLVDGSGHRQWLTGVYRASVLRARLAEPAGGSGRRGGSMRALVSGLRLTEVAARGREADDVDTWTDLP